MNHRFDDKKEVISERLKEYENQSQPIIREIKRRNFRIITINGSPLPYKIHNLIMAKTAKFTNKN